MKLLLRAGALVALLAAPALSQPALARARHSIAARPSPLTGSYEAGDWGTLDVQALPGGRIRFHLIALAVLHAPGGPNIGEAGGVLPVRGGVAVYLPDEGKGRLTLHFLGRRIRVTQTGDSMDMGFGAGVDASGVYVRTSHHTPKFAPEDR